MQSLERFAAFLRGVSPMNCKMQELAKAFAAAGFMDVKTAEPQHPRNLPCGNA